MIESLKNLDAAFNRLRLVVIFLIVFVLIFSLGIGYMAFKQVTEAQNRVYILNNGAAIEALASDIKSNRMAEAKHDIDWAHQLMFGVDPDQNAIERNLSRATYLGDKSVSNFVNNLREKGYYKQMIATNTSSEIYMDSVQLNMTVYPYLGRYFGKQVYVRPSGITRRLVISEFTLRDVARSDNNPNGFLIQDYKVVQNVEVVE